jgi:hypothetical protein
MITAIKSLCFLMEVSPCAIERSRSGKFENYISHVPWD